MPAVVELQDPRLEALLRERVADTLRDRGDLSEALTEYERVMRSTADRPGRVHARRRSEAAVAPWAAWMRRRSIRTAEAFERKTPNPRLSAAIQAARTEGALADGRGDTR